MSYTIKWSPKVVKELRKLPPDAAKRLISKVKECQSNLKNLEKLSDDPGYKVRAGDYRAVVDILEEERIIAVRIVDHRKRIYKRLKRQ